MLHWCPPGGDDDDDEDSSDSSLSDSEDDLDENVGDDGAALPTQLRCAVNTTEKRKRAAPVRT